MALTKDEKYIICAYEMAKERGDLSNAINRYEVGEKLGVHERGVNAICRLLAQANFIKNANGAGFTLTELGKKLVESLLEAQ